MKLDYKTYRDKVLGCWTGKNIGGVLGAPYEGFRFFNQVEFYTQDLSNGPPPNDDLDLQIVWLAAVERYGRNVNASILGDYWLAYIIPNWVEYGMGKANLRAGLPPPVSGFLDNPYKDSCGCFIRSEIWACLAPGHPEIAARYAYEDAIVDHAGEGMFGEIFFAALQSAAFVESDPQTLINIGLSYIPDSSAIARCIRQAIACKEEGVDFAEARKRIHNESPGTFGIQNCTISDIPRADNEGMEIGQSGFDAPENVGFTIAGWLYGDGDFGKSLSLAVACGEDTDCTAATLGAVMGIIQGENGIPAKWKDPLNDKIATLCIDKTSQGIWVPNTATELTDRILRATPGFLGHDLCTIYSKDIMSISCLEKSALYCTAGKDYIPLINGNGKSEDLTVHELVSLSPFIVRYHFPAFQVHIDYCESVFFKKGENKTIKVTVYNSSAMRQQQWARITAYMPSGAKTAGASSVLQPLNNLHGSKAEAVFEIVADDYFDAKLSFILDVSLEGRHSSGAVKVVLMRG